MFKKILLTVAGLVIVFAIVVALQPSEFRVTRQLVMTGSPAAVFSQVNDLHRWPAWSPWEKLDPAMKRRFDGASSGVGASYRWEGNNEVGSGRMTITESRPNEVVQLKLEFYKPMAGESMTEFTFKPQGRDTTVTWEMTGKNNFIGKAVCLFVNMDKTIGGQFEQGLTALKTLVETGRTS
jgi:hypothetical protein